MSEAPNLPPELPSLIKPDPDPEYMAWRDHFLTQGTLDYSSIATLLISYRRLLLQVRLLSGDFS